MRWLIILVAFAVVPFAHPANATQSSDTPCLIVTLSQRDLTEGGSIGYTVALPYSPLPGEIITVTPAGFNADRVTITPDSRDITTDSWQIGRVFTLSIDDNTSNDPDVMFTRLSHVAVSSLQNSALNGLQACAPIPLTIRDNDSGITLPDPTPLPSPTPDRSRPGITFTQPAAPVAEGGSVTVQVMLNMPPAMDESLIIFPLFDPAQLSISPNIRDLNFSNWGAGAVFSFTVIDDGDRQGERPVFVTFYVTSTDPYSLYFDLTSPAQLTITVRDND